MLENETLFTLGLPDSCQIDFVYLPGHRLVCNEKLRPGSVTIVVPTHDRPEKLRALLQSLGKSWIPELDSVVVVDDSKIPADLSSEYENLNIKHLILGKRIFISRAKNIGWREARTEFVFFIDDDNVVDGETVPSTLKVISRDHSLGAVMPAVLYKSRPDLVWVYAAQFLNSGPKFNLIGRNLPRNGAMENRLLVADALPNASLIRRASIEAVGGFDERLVVNSSMDLALRFKRKGWRVVSYTGAFIYHDVEPPGKLGWWATHGAVDPERVRYEIRDWFIIMNMIHGDERLFTLRAMAESSRFVLPNLLAYAVRGRSRRELVASLARGYAEGLRLSTSRR